MKIAEDFRKQSRNRNKVNGLTGIMPCRNPSHRMASGTWCNFGPTFSSDQCTISCPQSGTGGGGGGGGEIEPHLSAMPRNSDHRACLELCEIAPSQGRYTRRHNRVLQELAAIIFTIPETNALVFVTKGGTKSWHGRSIRTINQK